MRPLEILVSPTDVPLSPAPIRPEWIVEGSPQARDKVISTSADYSALTVLWDCTAGVFNWHYWADETLYIIEGGMTLTDASGTRQVVAGDHVFFPAGSSALWRVDNYVRKIAFFRYPLPRSVVLAKRVLRRVRALGRAGGDKAPSWR